MSDQWLYRIYGQEFGPVSLDLVRTLVATGAIAPDDEVRDVSRSNWILACAATELRDSITSQSLVPDVDRRIDRDEWFCRGYAGDYGPLALSELIQLAADGELQPDEEIKSRADDYWRQVCTIKRLVELLPFSNDPAKPGRKPRSAPNSFPSSINRAEILPFPGINPLNPSTVETSPCAGDREVNTAESSTPDWEMAQATSADSVDGVVTALAESDTVPFPKRSPVHSGARFETELNEDEWTGWMSGEEFGPVKYTELLMWAVTGRLSPTDFVRRGNEGQYVPAVNIPCLFTVRAAANSLSRRPPQPKIRIAQEPAEAAGEPTKPIAQPASTPSLTETQSVSAEAGLFRAVTSLQNLARQFASKILNRTNS